MIQDQDRAGWFGASDTGYIMGNWRTKTFKSWWLAKLGLSHDHFTTRAMNAGTYYEHAILDAIGAPRKDHQILIPELSLRVNLDGDATGRIWEVKTHMAEKPYKPTKAHIQQVQVQMFAKMKDEGTFYEDIYASPRAEIVSYGLLEEDYKNFFHEIDLERLQHHPVAYDPLFVSRYLTRLEYLRFCLLKGVFPDEKPG